jgi:3-methylcrotonyl-CoA carboxylase alpha subunit
MIEGHAFEARVYAEDVPKGFLPATGTLDHLSFPSGSEFALGAVRIDSGVREGDEISPWYDPMIAKVIVHGPTRETALHMLTRALADCHVAGSVTNLAFLGALSRHSGFTQGDVDTGLIGRDLDSLVALETAPPTVVALAGFAALDLHQPRERYDPWDQLIGWRQWTNAQHHVDLVIGDIRLTRTIEELGNGRYRISDETDTFDLGVAARGDTRFALDQDGIRSQADVVRGPSSVSVFIDGHSYTFNVPDALDDAGENDNADDTIVAPMPGTVKVVTATVGMGVNKGDPLMVLEAMKMEHTLTAPRDGIVAEVFVTDGDQVTDGTLLLSLEQPDG